MRTSISLSALCEGLPAAFEVFLNYACSLDFKQKPDYQYLQNLFCTLLNTDDNSYPPEELFLGTPAPKAPVLAPAPKTPALKTPKKRAIKHEESKLPMTRK